MLGWKVVPRIGFDSFSVSPHGVGIMVGYFVGVLLMARRARRRGFDEDHVWNAAAWGVVGAILGARIAYLVGHLDEFSGPIEWLKIWEGGISLVGGLIGGFSATFIYVRRVGVDFFELTDLAAPGLALGTVIGRIGDLMIGDHLGKATSGWWGWKYEGGELISAPPCQTPAGDFVYPTIDGCIEPGTVVHQTALYDQLWSVVILGVLLLLDRNPRRRGFLSLAWVVLYGFGRVATDFLRVDKTWLGLGLTGSQITSIIFVLIAAFLLIRHRGVPGKFRPIGEVPVDEVPDAVPVSTVAPAAAATTWPSEAAVTSSAESGEAFEQQEDSGTVEPTESAILSEEIEEDEFPEPAVATDYEPAEPVPPDEEEKLDEPEDKEESKTQDAPPDSLF